MPAQRLSPRWHGDCFANGMRSSRGLLASFAAVLALAGCAAPVEEAGGDAAEAVSIGSRVAPFEPGFHDAEDGTLFVLADGTTKSVWATWGGAEMEACGGELQLGSSWTTDGGCQLRLAKEGSAIRLAGHGLYVKRAPGAIRGTFGNDRGFALELRPSDKDPANLAYVLTAGGATFRGDAVPGGRNVARSATTYATLAGGCELDITLVRSNGGWARAHVERTRDKLADRNAERTNAAACNNLFGYATDGALSEDLVRR